MRPGRRQPRLDIETGEEEPWELKDLRKTCVTYYDEHVPESSVEIVGQSVGGITRRHYAHLAPPGLPDDRDTAAAECVLGRQVRLLPAGGPSQIVKKIVRGQSDLP